MSNIFSDNTSMSHIHENHDTHKKHKSASFMSKMISIYCLTLDKWRPYWIVTHNAMSKTFFDNTAMSGIAENPMKDTKNTNLPILCRKWYQFVIWPWTNGGHLGFFTHNAVSKIFSDNGTVSGLPENPIIDRKTLIYLYCAENDINLMFDLS